MTVKMLASSLLLGTTLALAPLAAYAQEGTTPAAPAAEAPAAPAAETQAAPAAPAVPATDVVIATVSGETITEADLIFAAEDLSEELQQMPPEDQRAFLVTVLIDMKIMAQAAKAAGMDGTDLFKRRVNYMEERALRRAYFAENVAAKVTEASMRAAYDTLTAGFVPEEEVHARHILVATKEEDDAVKDELDAGKPFEVLAMEKTTDPSGKQNGGDLGFFSKGMMVPEFETTAFALEPGQVSDPVQSQFGWHVIRLDEKRMTAPPPFEQVVQQLGQQVMFEAFDTSMGALKANAVVVIPDATLAAAVAAQSEPEAAAPAEAPAEAAPATP